VALGATIHVFNIDLADSDRGVYQPLELRVARHPSETAEYFLTRILAYCFEYTEGIVFSNGLFEPDEPTIAVRDLTGVLRVWIDVGAPGVAREGRGQARAAHGILAHGRGAPCLPIARRGNAVLRHRADRGRPCLMSWDRYVATRGGGRYGSSICARALRRVRCGGMRSRRANCGGCVQGEPGAGDAFKVGQARRGSLSDARTPRRAGPRASPVRDANRSPIGPTAAWTSKSIRYARAIAGRIMCHGRKPD
jgi:hypothetical protein